MSNDTTERPDRTLDLIREALRRDLKAEFDMRKEQFLKKLSEDLDRERDSFIGSVMMKVTKQMSIEMMGQDIRITVSTKDLTEKTS